MDVLTGLLMLGSFAAIGFGLLSLTEATLGVGLVGAACYLGILARLCQADDQMHRFWKALKAKMGWED